jgi:hypothetical protein
MKNQLFGLSMGFAALIAATDVAKAEQTNRCAPCDVVITRLSDGYGETRRSIGLAANSTLVEMHASEESGTWSITVTHPNGLTCLVAAGNSFEEIQEELPASLGAPT